MMLDFVLVILAMLLLKWMFDGLNKNEKECDEYGNGSGQGV